MTKTKLQKQKAKLGRKGPAQPVANLAPKKARKRNRKKKMPIGKGMLGGGTRRLPLGVSMVSDGVNVGSVWKNTTAERVTFPVAREKFADLTSTASAFEIVSQLYLNPGNATLFPIFSNIAKCYEEYIPNVLRVYYRTEAYMASGSVVSAGLAGMAVDFDANDSNFQSMTQLENYEHSISGAPYSGIMCLDILEEVQKRKRLGLRGTRGKDLSMNNYFVYNSDNSIGPSTDQAKFYDVGNFQFALASAQAATNIGELWIEYSFTLIRRKSPEVFGLGLAAHLYNYADNATAASPMGLTPFSSFSTRAGSTTSGTTNMATAGGLSYYATGSYIGFNDASDTVVNLPNVDGVFLVVTLWSGATAISTIPSISTTGGAVALSKWGPTGGSAPYGFFLAAGTSSTMSMVVTTTKTSTPVATSNALVWAGNATMTDANIDIYVVRLPNSLLTLLTEDNVRGEHVTKPSLVPVDRMKALEAKVKELMMKNVDDWGCRPSFEDKRKPDIPLRTVEPDCKSSGSVSSLKKGFFSK